MAVATSSPSAGPPHVTQGTLRLANATAAGTTAAVDLTNGTVTITGGTGGSLYTLLTAASITGTPVLAPSVPGYQLQVVDGVTDELRLVKTGTTTIATIRTQFQAWAGGAVFGEDANGDGISNGLAFLLGASGPGVNALDKLPVVTQTGGDLKLTFDMLPAAARGSAQLFVEHGSDLGTWAAGVLVPDASGGTAPVTFIVTDSNLVDPKNPLDVEATISASEADAGKLFGRLKAENP